MRALALAIGATALAGCSNLLGIDHFATGSSSDASQTDDAPANQPDAPPGTPDGPVIDAMPGAPDAKVDAMPGAPDAMVVADFSMTLTGGAAHTPLGTQLSYTVTVTSSNFTGTVSLAAENVPTSWSSLLAPQSLSLTSGDVKTATFTVTIPTLTTELVAPNLGVTGTGGGKNHDAQSALTIDNFVNVYFADGIGAGAHNLPPQVDIALGAGLHIVDQDTTAQHEVHASNPAQGFPHQAMAMNAGQEYDVTPTAAGTYTWYCHVHTTTGMSNLVVH